MASVFTRLAPIATLLGIVSRSRAYGWIDAWPAGITHSLFSPVVGYPETDHKRPSRKLVL
jgi:hypothetical protein